jgi:uncharacterized protein (DUF2141 family)
MKKFSFIFFISLFINVLNTFAQFTLTVEFTNLRNNNGNLLYELFDAKQKSLKVGTVDISNNKCVVVFENLKPAKYGVNFIHDENKNKKLDTKMLMIPKEGFGYSNNPTVKFGPPAYEKWIFEVKENTKITCKTTYLNY